LAKLQDQKIWDKAALISLDFNKVAAWDGKRKLPSAMREKIAATVHKAHAYGKPIRFWGCPDTETAWKTFAKLGIDFINTDHPAECSRYLRGLP